MPGPPHQLEIIMSEGNVAADPLRLFIERIERLEEEKKGIADDITAVYSEAKSTDYDTTTMRTTVHLRRSEERSVGNKLVSTCSYGWLSCQINNKHTNN